MKNKEAEAVVETHWECPCCKVFNNESKDKIGYVKQCFNCKKYYMLVKEKK